jgi:hypothetical protein
MDAFAAQDTHQHQGDADSPQQLHHAAQRIIMRDHQGAPGKKDQIHQPYHIQSLFTIHTPFCVMPDNPALFQTGFGTNNAFSPGFDNKNFPRVCNAPVLGVWDALTIT